MLETLKALVEKDNDLPERVHTLSWREEFRTGKIYSRLKYGFFQERNEANEYVPLSQRRPSVRFCLPMIIVNDTTSLLFSEGHFPSIEVADDTEGEIEGRLLALVKTTRLREVMLDASVRGSVGSIAIHFQVLSDRVFWKVLGTRYLTPHWRKEEPDTLDRVVEQYKVKGADLAALGYQIEERDRAHTFWFRREWTDEREIWFMPWTVARDETLRKRYPENVVDERRTVDHGLGFVPIVWIRNLPGGDDIDGACTFEAALDNSIEIDYQLSQAGRGLKYSSDPTLHIREPAYQELSGRDLVRSASNAIVTGPEGDVRILEISGSAATAVIEYARFIREVSLEICGGNRAAPERLSGAQSGRAMELMNQGLIWLTDKLRTSYGEQGLMSMLHMVIRANGKREIVIGEDRLKVGELGDPKALKLTLKWPPWYQPTAGDHQAFAAAIATYRTAGVLSRETAIKQIMHDFDIEDPDAEMARLDDDAEREAKAALDAQPRLAGPQPAVKAA